MFKQLLIPANYYFNPFAYPVMFVGILIFSIGFFILKQNKRAVLNISFFLFSLSSSLWLITISFVYLSRTADIALVWYRYFTFFGVVNIMPSLIFLGVVWAGEFEKRKIFLSINYLISFIFYILAITTDKVIITHNIRKYFWGFYPIYGPWACAYIIFFLIQFPIGINRLYLAYKLETLPIKKLQLKTIIIATLIAFTASVDFLPKFFFVGLYPYGYISMFIFISLVGYSIVRYKAFNIETIIHKTIMWLAASSIISIPIVSLSYWLKPWYKEATPIKVAFLCAGIFYLLTLYLKLIQPKIDHFFQRRKYDLERASERFTSDLVHLKGPTELIKKIEQTLKDTLYPKEVSIFLYSDKSKKLLLAESSPFGQITGLSIQDPFLNWLSKNDTLVYSDFVETDPKYESIRNDARDYFKRLDVVLTTPLVLDNKLLGTINLGKKSNLKRYNAYDFQFLLRLKNEATISLSNSLLYGRVEEEVKIRTDELIQTQKQLVQAEKLATVGTLAGGVAHEINNPLAAVLTNAQMLLLEAKDQERIESLQLIEQAAKRCREIVQKLMLYSRKPLGGRQIREVDIQEALNNVLSFLEYQLAQDNIKVTTNQQNPPFVIKGSQTELEQVFTNLILNAKDAIKHTKKSGNINVSITKQDNKIIIKVKDDGIGISKKHLPKIFDPFFTTKDVGKGTGLGLSISQSIIEQHGGTITVDSVESIGTAFSIMLPGILTNTKLEQSKYAK